MRSSANSVECSAGVRARAAALAGLGLGAELGDRVADEQQRVELLALIREHVKVAVLELQVVLRIDGARDLERLSREGERGDAPGGRARVGQLVELRIELDEIAGVVAVHHELGRRLGGVGRIGHGLGLVLIADPVVVRVGRAGLADAHVDVLADGGRGLLDAVEERLAVAVVVALVRSAGGDSRGWGAARTSASSTGPSAPGPSCDVAQ